MNTEEKAKYFIRKLRVFTNKYLNPEDEKDFQTEAESLRALFDDFAIIDVFSSMRIVDCYNEIKISLMKLKRFANKPSNIYLPFKMLLNHFYTVMDHLYFYEIFGFFSTTVHPEDIPELNLPCKVFCGCADGWQKEPYLAEEGNVEYADVVRFQNPENSEVPLCMTIEKPHLLEERNKCSLSDEQLKSIQNFVRINKGIITLHNMGIIDSPTFHGALKTKISPEKHTIKYRIVYSCKKYRDRISLQKKYYIDMDDMTYEEAQKLYKQIEEEMQESCNAAYEDLCLTSLEILHPDEGKNFCCFCDAVFDGDGNSTWPIYYKQDGEKCRCCDACNEKYVTAARRDYTLIMGFRKQFGIDYAE